MTRSALIMRASAAVCFYMFLGVGLVLLAIAQQPREIIIESPDARSVATDGVGAMDSSRSEEYSARLTMFGSNSGDVEVLGISRRLGRKRNKRKRPAADASLATVLRLKAVRSYFDELDRAERAARSESEDSGAPPKTSSEATTGEPRLVTTRKFSGRIQTGCVGGCF